MNFNILIKILSFSNIGNLLSLIYLIIISKYLLDNDFSLITSLTSLSVSISYIFSFYIAALSNKISKIKNCNYLKLYKTTLIKIFYLFVFIFLFFVLAKNQFYNFFKFNNFNLIILIFAITISNIIVYIQLGIISGISKFKFQSKIICLQQFFRVILLILFFSKNYESYYPLLSTLIGFAITIAIFHIYILKKNENKKNSRNDFKLVNINLNSDEIGKSIVLTFTCSILIYSDIIISRYIFDYSVSSQFNLMSSLSKVNYYFLSSVLITIIPFVNNSKTQNKKNSYFYKICILIIALMIFTNLIYYFFSDFIFENIFEKNNKLSKINMIKINSTSILYTCSIIILNWFYSKWKLNFSLILIPILIIFLTILLNQQTVEQFINIFFFINILILIFFILKFNNSFKKIF